MSDNKIKEIINTYELLVKANQEIGHVWILPDPVSNLNFAFTECAEVIDALMRQDERYFRNNTKTYNLREEGCDVVMMLMKYLMSLDTNSSVLHREVSYSLQLRGEENIDLDVIGSVLQAAVYISKALLDHKTGSSEIYKYFSREDTVDCIVDIVWALEGGELESYLGTKVEKYYKKINNA